MLQGEEFDLIEDKDRAAKSYCNNRLLTHGKKQCQMFITTAKTGVFTFLSTCAITFFACI